MNKTMILIGCMLLAACNNGVDVNFQEEFAAIDLGDTERELQFSTHSKTPLFEESFEFAGFELNRREWKDMQGSTYAIYTASSPVSEARVIAKLQSKQNLIRSN